ncbi:hypothetical protein DFS33DRAFT_1380646 [Desarmillaria ectypa]|nr:hypothetical protein DFS33DRAFT_1380646 [Desarmillaria ectypa]
MHSAASTRTPSLQNVHPQTTYSSQFTDRSTSMKASRAMYMKAVAAGTLAVTIGLFDIDFNGSTVRNAVVHGFLSSSSRLSWTERPSSDFSGGVGEVADLVVDQKTWTAVVVNSNATTALQSALSSVNSSYDGSEVITVYTVEARNENTYYTLNNLRPFDISVASAVTFVGLIYLLVLSFFIVNFCSVARQQSGLETALTTDSLIKVR